METTIENNQRINGKREGYWEHHYLGNDLKNLLAKGNYKNNTRVGYWEFYNLNGEINTKKYFI